MKVVNLLKPFWLLLAIECSSTLNAEPRYRGTVQLGSTWFNKDHKETSKDYHHFIAGELDLSGQLVENNWHLALFAGSSANYTSPHLYINEAWVEKNWSSFSVKLGLQVFDWTFLEIFTDFDNVNSRNEIYGATRKIGETAVTLESTDLGTGRVSLVYLPSFRQPVLPDAESRWNTPALPFEEKSTWTDSRGEIGSENEAAGHGVLRYQVLVDSLDIAMNIGRTIDRMRPITPPDSTDTVNYQTGDFASMSGQILLGQNGLLRLGKIYRFLRPANHVPSSEDRELSSAGGAEWTTDHSQGASSTVIAESILTQFSSKTENRKRYALGYLFRLNNIADEEYSIYWIHDSFDFLGRSLHSKYKRRLGDYAAVSIVAGHFSQPNFEKKKKHWSTGLNTSLKLTYYL